MKHPRYIEFTNAELASMDADHLQIRDLADFLWNDPRPHEEHKFEMGLVARDWDSYDDDPAEALSRCDTAACACGWEILRSGDRGLYRRSGDVFGEDAAIWMFGGGWFVYDNSPFGASFRIDHYLKHRDPTIYGASPRELIQRHYPRDAFWMEAT